MAYFNIALFLKAFVPACVIASAYDFLFIWIYRKKEKDVKYLRSYIYVILIFAAVFLVSYWVNSDITVFTDSLK